MGEAVMEGAGPRSFCTRDARRAFRRKLGMALLVVSTHRKCG